MEPNAVKTPDSGGIIPGLPIRGVSSWNIVQNWIALVGVALVVLLIVFPPWEAAAPNGMTGSIRHYLIFSSTPAEEYKYPSIDYGRLFLEMFGVALVSAVAIFIARSSKCVLLSRADPVVDRSE